MLRTLKIPVLFVTILLVVSSCLSYEEVQIIKFAGVNVNEMSAAGVIVDVNVRISNPNNYKISVVKTNLMVELNGKDLGKAKMKGNLVLPKNSNEVHAITIEMKGNQLKEALPSMLSMALGGSPKMRIHGSITARARMLRKKIDVDFTDAIKL